MLIIPGKFKSYIKLFYENKTEESIQEIKDLINQFHKKNEEIKIVDVQKFLKIEFIRPELREAFPEFLEQGYWLFKDNGNFHRERKAEQKKERAMKHNV